LTADRCVEIVGLRLLEPADLNSSNTQLIRVDSPAAAAALVLSGSADVAFLATESHAALTLSTRRQLLALVKSDIGELAHLLLCHPRQADRLAEISNAFLSLSDVDTETASAMRVLGLELGFTPLTPGQADDMLDLVETLRDQAGGSLIQQ
jgi:phosphonate transport system substrate-binding protein